jgi:ribosomal subunit interface protein
MNITIKGTNYTLTDDVRNLVETKLGALQKLLGENDAITLCQVELGEFESHRTKDIFYAEVNVDAGKRLYRATAEGQTMQAAIDMVEGELMREIRKEKGKTRRFIRHTGAKMKSFFKRGS